MKSQIIILSLCLFLRFYSVIAQQPRRHSLQPHGTKSETIDQNKAIAISNRAARKTYKRLERFTVVPCEGLVLWRIIYDGGGPEYVIDKRSGKIIKVEHLPQGSSSGGRKLNQEEAIEIAKRDARAKYGDREDVDKYDVRACEEAKAWRIVFDFRPPAGTRYDQLILPNGSMPQYVIDKTSGKILYRARD